jgi:hypothetical protein
MWSGLAPDDPIDLPDGARRLLLGPVDSFEKLEVLLALHESAGAALTRDALAARAGVPAEQLEQLTSELVAAGLVQRLADSTYRIGTGDAAGVRELAAAWATSRPAVLKAMTGRAVGRIRASAARTFAEAFRLRQRKDDGESDG